MEFRHLEAFVTVAQTGSFTAASEHMHLSQPAVSQLIGKLEYSVGEPLFIRSTRRLEMTERARELIPVAYEILGLRRLVLDKSGPDDKSLSGRLRVGTSSSATAFLWAAMFQNFARQFPLVELDIRTTSHTDQTRDDLLRGRLDIGILAFPHREPRLESIVLGNHSAELVCPNGHPLLDCPEPVQAAQLKEYPFLLYEKGINFRRLSDHFFFSHGLAPKIVMQSNDTYLIRAMVEVGFGIAFLPDWAIVDELATGRLVRLNVADANLTEEFGVAHLKNQVSRPAQVFIKFCLDNRNLLPDVARKQLPPEWRHFSEIVQR